MSRKILFYHIMFLSFVCAFFYSRNSSCLYQPYDGLYMLNQAIQFFKWNTITAQVSLNPLQGLSGIALPLNYWFLPSSVAFFFSNDILVTKILYYFIVTLEFFLSILFVSRAAHIQTRVALQASWLGVLLVMPVQNRIIFNSLSMVAPIFIEMISFSSIAIALLLMLYSSSSRQSIVITLCFSTILMISMAALPFLGVLLFPLVALHVLYALSGHPYKGMHWVLTTANLLLLLLPICICAFFVACLLLPTVPVFFNTELTALGKSALSNVSFLFNTIRGGPGWLGTAIYCLGVVGATIAWRKEISTIRNVARLFLLYLCVILFVGIILRYLRAGYNGPTMSYFEYSTWPFFFIFTAYACDHAFVKAFKYLAVNTTALNHAIFRYMSGITSQTYCILVPLLLCLILFCVSKENTTFFLSVPPLESRLVKVLKDRCEFVPGSPWRGSVAFFTGASHAEKPINWDTVFAYGIRLWSLTGNDHQTVGLWWHNIPTLFAYNQFISADYYYSMTRFFSSPNVVQQRNVAIVTSPNIGLLQLFGVRYVLSEAPVIDDRAQLVTKLETSDLEPMASLQEFSTHPLILYALPSTNLGNYSPTKQVVAATARETVRVMSAPDFSPEHSVALFKRLDCDLVPSESHSLTWEKSSIRVKASSNGNSLLVLPVQFSNCLKIEPVENSNNGSSELVRADLNLTGVVFSGQIDARITFTCGLFSSPLCRLADYNDFRGMELGR